MENKRESYLNINMGWFQGIREGKKILYRGKLYEATEVGSCRSKFKEITSPYYCHYKTLINFKHWVRALWKSFLWVLKRGLKISKR